MSGSRNFCQFCLVLSLFYCLKRGSNGFIAEKTIHILYKGSRSGPLFSGGGGCPTFSRGGGGQMLISIETHIRTCYFQGECPDPLSLSGFAHGQCHHKGENIYHSPASNHNCQALICQD